MLELRPMSPDEGARLRVRCAFAPSPWGEVLVASTGVGVCALLFADDRAAALADLQRRLPVGSAVEQAPDAAQGAALAHLAGNTSAHLVLHLRGTAFQQAVWRLLLDVPEGQTTTYLELARRLGRSAASARAVGGAVGANPVAVLVPCHRVVQANGRWRGYAWGAERKKALLVGERQGIDLPPGRLF